MSIFSDLPLFSLLFKLGVVVLVGFLVYIIYKIITYYRSTYYKSTSKSYISMRNDLGSYGEYLIYDKLKKEEKNGGKFLFNTYLFKNDGTTTEIDVILINRNGIFVFESKNYSGWIFGSENQKNWTQCLPQGKGNRSAKEHFLNPIFQNKLHIKTLSETIGNDLPFYSIITFSERCSLKNINNTDTSVIIITRDIIYNTIKQLGEKTKYSITEQKVNELYQTLYPFTQVSSTTKQQHIENIQNKINTAPTPCTKEDTYQTQIETDQNTVCPRCGGTLVLRTGKNGKHAGKQFYGCSNFPKCRYIKNI